MRLSDLSLLYGVARQVSRLPDIPFAVTGVQGISVAFAPTLAGEAFDALLSDRDCVGKRHRRSRSTQAAVTFIS